MAEGYTPERVKAIVRNPGLYEPEEWLDVDGVLKRMMVEGDVGAQVLYLWGTGWTQTEALTYLGVKGRASSIFRRALERVAKELNGEVRGIDGTSGERKDQGSTVAE